VTATSEVRFGADGAAKVQSYVRLTGSTWIRCCTYEDAAPILTINDGPAEITITNPGRGEVTEEDVRFGRLLAEAVTRYAAELERLASARPTAIRNLFPDRIAMRLDEPEQVDMVLGDGARDRGAACELISADPATGAGVAFVRLESDPDPVRVRAGWVTDADIRALAAACFPAPEPIEPIGWPEVAA
jgi:hypothetical protein